MINCAQCPFEDQAACNPTNQLETSAEKTPLLFQKNSVLFSEFEKLNGIYCLKKGICKVSKMSHKGRDQIIEILVKGTLLGFRSVLNEERTSLKAVAISDMEVCFVPKEKFLKTLKKDSKFSIQFIKILSSYIKKTDEKIFDMGQFTLEQRAAKFVLNIE